MISRTHLFRRPPVFPRPRAARLVTRLAPVLAAILTQVAIASLAHAAEPVELKPAPISHGSMVTLGDLFDGVDGPAAQMIVAHAAQAAGLQAVLDADRVQVMARSAGVDWENPRGLHRIIVTSEGEAAAVASHRARPSASGRRASQALVYARNIMAGEIVSASDLQWSDDVVAGADSPGDPDYAIGKAARRPLRAGAAVQAQDLVNPLAVHRNDSVDVAYDADGVTLTLEARSMNDGSVGDTIQIVNPQSKKVIEAVVSAPGRAVVGPEAELLKAQAFTPALRTAALR